MFSISPIIEESITNSSSSLGKLKKTGESMSGSQLTTDISNKLKKIEITEDDKTTPKRNFHLKRKYKNGIQFGISPNVKINSPPKNDENNDNKLIKAAIELDEDNDILSPSTGIVTDFSISEKFTPYKNDKNARFFSYDDIKKIDNSFDVPSSSCATANSPKIYINSTSTVDSILDEGNDVFNMTMIEDVPETINKPTNESKNNEEKRKVTFSEELVKIDNISEREEVSIVHDYYYYSDDEQTVFHHDIDDNEVKSLNDSSETIISLSEDSNKDVKEALDSSLIQVTTDTYNPLDLLENFQNLNSSVISTGTAYEIDTPITLKKEVSVQTLSSTDVNDNYEHLTNQICEIKKNQENFLEIIEKLCNQNEILIEKATKNNEEVINNLKNKICELETELELSDREIIDCCNRATHYRRIYLELAVEGNKITVEDAVGQMNDPTYNDEYFQKFKKISDNDVMRSLSSFDMTNKRITIERLDKASNSHSTLKRISSFLSPRKSST